MIPARSSSDVAVSTLGMFSLIAMPWPGLMPQVTVGAIVAASIFTTSSYVAPGSEAKDFQVATAASHAAPCGE